MVPVGLGRGRLLAVVITSRLTRRCARGGAVGLMALVVAACGAARSGTADVAKPDRVSFEATQGSPFGISVTRDGRYAFMVLVDGRVAVYSLTSAHPRLVRTIPLHSQAYAYGCSLTRDGRLLLVAEGRGAAVI